MNYKNKSTVAKLSSKHSGFFFLLIISLIILSQIFPISDNPLIMNICFFLIATIGVSHGSLDNFKGEKLLKKYKIKHKFLFYLSYIFLAFITVVIWNYLPFFTLLLFLVVASYHFGKEDTEPFLYTSYATQGVKFYGKYTKSYYFFTFFKGFLIIAAPLFFHFNETKEIFKILDSNFILHEDFIVIFWCISFYSYIHFIFIKKALPLTLLTAIFFFISLYFLSNYYQLTDAILKVIFIGLASLTFPHILLEYLLEKNEK